MNNCEAIVVWNCTLGEHYKAFPSSRSDVAGEFVISFCGILLNVLLIIAHVKDPLKLLKGTSVPFIINIAVIDFITSCGYLVHALMVIILFNAKHIGDLAMYLLLWHLNGFLLLSSQVSFLGLSIERFASVVFPLWHRVKVTLAVCRAWIISSWLILSTFDGLTTAWMFLNPTVQNVIRLSIARNGLILITFLLTNFFYFATYISLKRQRNKLSQRQDMDVANLRANQIRLQNEHQFLVTIAIVCSILAVTVLPMLVPFQITLINMELSGYTIKPEFINWVGLTIAPVNFAINSLVYLWRWPKYRKTYKRLYCNISNM